MSIWFKPYTVAEVNHFNRFMIKQLGIEIIELGDDFIKGKMPVDDRTKMPLGLLHGGASCVLAETLASYGTQLCVDPETQKAVGLEINANHIRSITNGFVIGTAKPIHLGRSTHVWNIEIKDESDKLICVSRMTMAILKNA